MKDTSIKEAIRNSKLERFIKNRLIENKSLFSDEELSVANYNNVLIRKIYILGIKDCSEIYKILKK